MRQRYREKPPWGHRDREWRDVAASQGMPRTGGHHELEEARKDSTQSLRGAWPC